MIKRLFLLMLVALAVTMAVPSLRAKLVAFVAPAVNDVKARFVPRRLDAMADQLDVRLGRAEGLPANFEAWLRRDFSGSPQDPWHRSYYLEVGRRDYTVGSLGPDGLQGTPDDITERREYPER
jgi:hypothetical protein